MRPIGSRDVARFEHHGGNVGAAYADHRVWQDVYKPARAGRTFYVKFTIDARDQFFLVSFKKA